MVEHVNDKENGHSESVIALSLADLSVWCFACDEYITDPKLEGVFQEFHLDKFGTLPSDNLHKRVETGGQVTIMLERDNQTRYGAEQGGDEWSDEKGCRRTEK